MQPVTSNNLINLIPKTQMTSSYLNQQSALPSQKPDEVILSSADKDDKKKKSYKKWGILTGAAVAATAVGLIIRGRLKAVTKLAEHIDFTPAKTMEEAIEFAKTHLKIKKFDTANDLDLANWVNEGLVQINNKYKGRAHIPNEVRPLPPELKSKYKNTIAAMYSEETSGFRMRSRLTVNVDFFNDAHKNIEKMLKDFKFKSVPIEGTDKSSIQMQLLPFFNGEKLLDIMERSSKFVNNKATKMDIVSLRKSFGDYYTYSRFLSDNPMAVLEDVYSQKGVIENLKKYMPKGTFRTLDEVKTMTKKEQLAYLNSANNALSEKLSLKDLPSARILDSKRSVFDTLFHEEGHLFHNKNAILDYDLMHVVYDKQTGKPTKIGKLAKGFLESKEEQFIASKVSKYATYSPLEFVAEVYSRRLFGATFTDDIMKLYEKYHGPQIPA